MPFYRATSLPNAKRPYRAERRRLNPAFYDACRASGRPQWQLMLLAGIPHQSTFSTLICAETIPATPTNIAHLHRIADAIGFPKSNLFLRNEQEVAR